MLTIWIHEGAEGLLNPSNMEKYNDALTLIRKAGATVGEIIELTHPVLGTVKVREVMFDLATLETLKAKVPVWARKLIGI